MGNNRRHHLKQKSLKGNTIRFFITIIIISIVIFIDFVFFKVKKIECQQSNKPCTKATLDKINHLYNQSLFFTNFDKTLSQFSDYQIRKKLPSTIILNLENVQSNYYRLNEENIFVISEEENLDKTLNLKINDLVTQLEQKEIAYTNIKLEKNIFIIHLESGYRVLVNGQEIPSGVYKLEQILKNIQLQEIDTSIQEIDTRFKMPVLKTKQTVI